MSYRTGFEGVAMSYIYYDVETRANDRAREYFEKYWTPPGNMS
jgi:hypothetical protein